MARLEPDTQRQTAWTHAQPVKAGSGAAAVPQQPKVPPGISNVGTEPQAPTPSRPLAAPAGAGPRLSSHTLQLEAQAGHVTAGSAPHASLYAGQAQPSQAAPTGASPAAPSAQSKVEAIVKEALRQRDYRTALSEAYAKATPEERELMLNDTDVRAVIAEIVSKATAVLTNENAALTDQSTGGSMNPQARADSAIKSLNAMLKRLDPAFAGAVADEAVKVFKQFHNSHLARDGAAFGPQGITALTWLSGRIARTSHHAVADFVALNAWDGVAVGEAIAGGAGDAYAIAYAGYVKTQTGDASFVPRSLAEARVALQSKADDAMRALAEHGAEMAWVANNVCEPLGPELAQKAMDGYLAWKGDGWKKEGERLRAQIVESGAKLFRHMIALTKIGPGLGPSIREQLAAILIDPVAWQAIEVALNLDPNLIEGDGLKDVAGLLETLKRELRPVGQLAFLWVRMANVAANAFLRRAVLEKLAGLKPGDPAGAAKIAAELDGLCDKWFAKILGWSEADLDQAVTLVKKANAGYAENSMQFEMGVGIAKVRQLDAAVTAEFTAGINKLESRMAAFNGGTLAGQMMKGLVAAVAIGLNFVVSLNATIDHFDGVRLTRTVDLGVLAAQRGADLLVSLGVDPASAVGRYAALKLGGVPGAGTVARAAGWAGAKLADVPAVGRLVNAGRSVKLADVPIGEVYLEIYALLEAANAVKAVIAGDAVQTGISSVSAVGFGLAIAPRFGAAAWTGPWGIVIATVAAFSQMMYDDAKDTHKYEKASEICLKAAGFGDVAAAKISRQADYLTARAGTGQILFLRDYAERRNVSVLKLVNDLTSDEVTEGVYRENPDRVNRLSDNVLYALNQGDPSSHRDGQKWAGAALQEPQPPAPAVSPEEASKAMKKFEMDVFERMLVSDGILRPENVMPGPFWKNP
jgi:hypothetical protein